MSITDNDIAVIGLGLMGGEIARHLAGAGWTVRGHDLRAEARSALEAAGGIFCPDAASAPTSGGIILLSLPSHDAFRTVIEGVMRNPARPRCVIDTSTLGISEKEWARDCLTEIAVEFLDCPISGTAAQAVNRDLVIYASGPEPAVASVMPVFEAFSRAAYFVGPCGAGTKLKLVANLLVAVHNVAAAEAINLARLAGLDTDLVLTAIGEGAGSSRMLQVRGPMMVRRQYRPATMKVGLFLKDLDLIRAFSSACGAPTPLLAVADRLYRETSMSGLDDEDTAAVCSVLEEMSSLPTAN